MEQKNDWVSDMIKAQVDMAKDEAIGPAHLEKEVSKKQQESFVDKVKRTISGMKANMRRQDSGTRGKGERKHEDEWLNAEFEEKREEIARKQEIAQGLSGFENETEEGSTEDQILEEENQAGLDEYYHLLKDGKVHIDDETEFSDGWRADGSYKDGYWREPPPEELKQIEFEEKLEADMDRKKGNFERNKTGGGNRAGSQRVRSIR